MLSEILSKETCAKCRFCCSFRRQSLWETPVLSEGFMKKYMIGVDGKEIRYRVYEYPVGVTAGIAENSCHGIPVVEDEGNSVLRKGELIYGQTELSHLYKTTDPAEEVPCPFLDTSRGCTLPEDDKPFDCKIWPLRLMRTDESGKNLAVCLTPTCPAVNEVPAENVNALVKSGLGDRIFEQGEIEPYMIKDYREGFIIIENRKR